MNNNNFAIIMAGGIGTRFWPLSNASRPKQFIDILGTGKTLIQQTKDRLLKVCPKENILVVTSKDYFRLVHEQLPNLPKENILYEPFRRNTAPCIAYASYKIFNKCKDANIIVCPSDHIILDTETFTECLNEGIDFVSNNESLLTLGIIPSRAETGYGYIQQNNKHKECTNIKDIKTFTEKPDLETAEAFLKSGDYLWNSGIFLWNVKSILSAYKKYLPRLIDLFEGGLNKINTNKESELIEYIYSEIDSISIDYAILEKADNVCVLCADIGWSDLGTWKSYYELKEKDSANNVVNNSNNEIVNTTNCIINLPKDKTVIIEGLDNYIIAEHNDILLICRRDNEENIKKYAENIIIKKKTLD